ncbi:MAG: thiol reductase thioredoxin, partial [Myxococcales bacterium]|nr:thiol reductase thioredoxin [Myxococcales bacterium]
SSAALRASDLALERSYGPRKLRYMSVKADIQGRMNDHEGQLATLREEVAGRRALVRGDANRAAFEEARARLQKAEMTLRSRKG